MGLNALRALGDEAEPPSPSLRWGYTHFHSGTLSDTRMVCDWSHPPQLSEDTLALHPRCVHGVTCAGHHADDLLPFKVRDSLID